MAEQSQTATEVQEPDFSKMSEDEQWKYFQEHGVPEHLLKKDEKPDPELGDKGKKKSDPKSKDKSEEEEEEEEEEEKEEEEEEEKEEKEEKEEEEEKEKEEEEEEEEEEEGEGESDLDELINKTYGEDYEITTKAELDETLEAVDELLDENDNLKAQLEEAQKTPKEPVFASERQKSAWNFIKDFDPEQYGDKLDTWAKLQGMEVDKMDKKMVLEEHFIITHPELSRAQAARKFERDYTRKYVVDKEKFDSDAEYKEAKEDAEIDLTSDWATAKKYLKDQQTEFKAKPAENKQKEDPEINPVITKGIEQNAKMIDEYGDDFRNITYAPTGKDEDNFTVDFNAEQRKEIKQLVTSWVKNPGSYNEKGQLKVDFDAEEAYIRASRLLYGDMIETELWKHAEQVISAKRVDEIGKVKPTRKSKTGSVDVATLSEDQQWALHEKRMQGKLSFKH